LQNDGRLQRDLARKCANNLCRGDDGALLGRQCGERLGELGVAVVLAGIGGGEELFCGGKFSGELRAIAAVGAPGKIAG